MKTVCKQNMCAGCMACVDICPKQAIRVEGLAAFNAVIDPALCVECGACHKVCQQNEPLDLQTPISWQQGWAADNEIRAAGSSGGVAGALSAAFIKMGGAVCSCVFENGRFGFQIARTEQEIKMFSGSKYVKSNPVGSYRQVKKLLQQGTKVLFVGLPCQCAAVKKYVGKEQELLFTVDLICHGSPSQEVLEIFLRHNGKSLAELQMPTFRKKQKFALADNGEPFAPGYTRDRYTIAFLNALIYTENCYSCQYARQERVSDITLGDSWGSDLPQAEAEKGISLILCQTEKGQKLLESANLQLLSVDAEKAVENNHQLCNPSVASEGRERFFEELAQGKSFDKLVRRNFPKQCFRQKVKGMLCKMLYVGKNIGKR